MLPNSVHFRSAVAYWIYPTSAGTVHLGKGSGINLGYSLPTTFLENMSRPEFRNKHLVTSEKVAEYLGVSGNLLKIFLEEAKLAEHPDRDALPGSLMIEAGYSFSDRFLQDNAFTLEKYDDTGQLSYYRLENVIDKACTRSFLDEVLDSRESNPILPDWIRLRYQVSEYRGYQRPEVRAGSLSQRSHDHRTTTD